jgi:hypothetical protein
MKSGGGRKQKSSAFVRRPSFLNCVSSTGGGGRTRTRCYSNRILNPARLPFRHSGGYLNLVTQTTCQNNEIVGLAALREAETNRTEGRSQGDASQEFQFLTGGTDSLGKTDILEKSSLGNTDTARRTTVRQAAVQQGCVRIVISGAFWTAAFRKRGTEPCVR